LLLLQPARPLLLLFVCFLQLPRDLLLTLPKAVQVSCLSSSRTPAQSLHELHLLQILQPLPLSLLPLATALLIPFAA
jgi:hypothetical protein